MERSSGDHTDEEKGSAVKDPLLGTITSSCSSKGGPRTLPFILANEGFEKAASAGLEPLKLLRTLHEVGPAHDEHKHGNPMVRPINANLSLDLGPDKQEVPCVYLTRQKISQRCTRKCLLMGDNRYLHYAAKALGLHLLKVFPEDSRKSNYPSPVLNNREMMTAQILPK